MRLRTPGKGQQEMLWRTSLGATGKMGCGGNSYSIVENRSSIAISGTKKSYKLALEK